jgi:cytochrome c oxidase subunit 2
MSLPIPTSANDWYALFALFFYIGAVAASVVIGAMVYFSIKYRKRNGQPIFSPEASLSRSRAREAIVFASISAALLFSLSIASYRLTTTFQFPPSNSESLIVDVTAFQWNFNFRYPNGVLTTGECRVPADKAIIFNVTSSDVMHNFGLPAFKLKIDAIPGRYNIVWISTPHVSGNDTLNYQVRCYELCGTGHTYMIANLIVMEPGTFDQWLANQVKSNMTAVGG